MNVFVPHFQVELWLNKVLDTMRNTIRHELSEAVVSYEEKPRDQWLFDFPAQVCHFIYCLMFFFHSILFEKR